MLYSLGGWAGVMRSPKRRGAPGKRYGFIVAPVVLLGCVSLLPVTAVSGESAVPLAVADANPAGAIEAKDRMTARPVAIENCIALVLDRAAGEVTARPCLPAAPLRHAEASGRQDRAPLPLPRKDAGPAAADAPADMRAGLPVNAQ